MGFQTNSSNRILLNFINSEDFFGRILYVDENDLVQEHMLIKYSDLIPGGSYNFDLVGNGELILNFKNESLYIQLSEFMQQNACVMEVFIYKDYKNLQGGEFNKFYFFDYLLFENDIEENTKTRTFKFHTFTTAIESKTIIEHNVGYDFNSIPVDSDGNKIMPENYNKFEWDSDFESMIVFLYDKNLFDPVKKTKGDFHVTIAPERKLRGFGTLGFNVSLTNAPIIILENKQSLLDIRQLAHFFIKDNDPRMHIPEIKYDQSSKKLDITFNFTDIINLQNGLVKDNYTYFKNEVDFSDKLATILVESDAKDDNKFYNNPTPLIPNVWKGIEDISSGPIDKSNVHQTEPLHTIGVSELNKREIINTTSIGIDFKDKEFFKDLNAGQLIEMTDYGSLIDGQYRIEKISCVINETYLSFEIDEMERI